ncbi:Quinone-oxidoreductase homolog, chloroplastic-like protein [Drosera capensis]
MKSGSGDRNYEKSDHHHGHTLFVNFLPFNMKNLWLRTLFGDRGEIVFFVPSKMPRNPDRKFGFVRFASKLETEYGRRSMDGRTVANMKMKVSWSKYERKWNGQVQKERPKDTTLQERRWTGYRTLRGLVPDRFCKKKIREHVEIPVPEPKVDEVLVKVEASTINPVDWKIEKVINTTDLFSQVSLCTKSLSSLAPFTCSGTDLAGEVVKVGPAVKKFKPGDKIVAVLSLSTKGALAEYAVVKERSTVQRPEEVTAAQAAGLPIAVLTA